MAVPDVEIERTQNQCHVWFGSRGGRYEYEDDEQYISRGPDIIMDIDEANALLVEMLRGPAGPQGPSGAMGVRGRSFDDPVP